MIEYLPDYPKTNPPKAVLQMRVRRLASSFFKVYIHNLTIVDFPPYAGTNRKPKTIIQNVIDTREREVWFAACFFLFTIFRLPRLRMLPRHRREAEATF